MAASKADVPRVMEATRQVLRQARNVAPGEPAVSEPDLLDLIEDGDFEDVGDNLVLSFEIKPLGVRGRLVRLGAAVDDILHRHDYPPAVSALLAEAVALTAMLGAMLKFDGKFIVQ